MNECSINFEKKKAVAGKYVRRRHFYLWTDGVKENAFTEVP